jgi:hypothetical protein
MDGNSEGLTTTFTPTSANGTPGASSTAFGIVQPTIIQNFIIKT